LNSLFLLVHLGCHQSPKRGRLKGVSNVSIEYNEQGSKKPKRRKEKE
jgi:hypothetical protein